jgi:hypothetical protein
MADAAPPPGGTPPPPQTPWHQGIADADTIGAWTNKGLDMADPAKLAVELTKHWKAAERHVGVPADRLLRLPEKPDDTAGWNTVWQKLGAPAEAKDYDFSTVKFADGTDLEQSFIDTMRATFAARHLPKEAATEVTKAVVKYLESAEASENSVTNAARQTQLASLEAKWGAQKDANMLQALNGARRLGLNPDQVKGIERAIGLDVAAELFRKIGIGTNEDTFVEGRSTGGQPATSEAAQSRLNDLKSDPEWTKRYLSGSQKERREFHALMEQITGISEAAELAALGSRP